VSAVTSIPVIDIDTHWSEPPDLWTSRMPERRWGDRVPHVVYDEARRESVWQVGDERLSGVAAFAMAGWNEFFPSHPKSLDEADPASWNPLARVERMDQHGVYAQVLYPNILGFATYAILKLADRALMLDIVRAYNDALVDFVSGASERFIPVMALPVWDVDASVAEMRRSAARGHKGFAFGGRPELQGLPTLRDDHWLPLWAVAQDLELSCNFHIGFASSTGGLFPPTSLDFARLAPNSMLSNCQTLTELTMSGICHRYPKLDFVSVESGVGWVPWLVEALDWQWIESGAYREHPDHELPGFYFRRQCYTSFWYERAGLDLALEQFPDNIMFETDFPHPMSLSPGPASSAKDAAGTIAANLANVPEPIRRKVLYENAARVYHHQVPESSVMHGA
jgi:predicted TIM-barrel fold metal-dependent hydrolase